MKNKFRNWINVVLGALSVGFIGCRHAAPTCLYGPPPEPDKYGCPPEVYVDESDSTLEQEPVKDIEQPKDNNTKK
jgi:hypothetical protein